VRWRSRRRRGVRTTSGTLALVCCIRAKSDASMRAIGATHAEACPAIRTHLPRLNRIGSGNRPGCWFRASDLESALRPPGRASTLRSGQHGLGATTSSSTRRPPVSRSSVRPLSTSSRADAWPSTSPAREAVADRPSSAKDRLEKAGQVKPCRHVPRPRRDRSR
jgi:hypothetical protein